MILCFLQPWACSNITKLRDKYYHTHSLDVKIEAQRGTVSCPRWHSQQSAKAGIRSRICLSSKPLFFILILCPWSANLYILGLTLYRGYYLVGPWWEPRNSSCMSPFMEFPDPKKILQEELGASFPWLPFHLGPWESGSIELEYLDRDRWLDNSAWHPTVRTMCQAPC